MARIYEGMYLLDNAVVREDWNKAKSIVTGTLEKHGATVLTARRWGERRLAYPIKRRNRASFLLTYFELPPESFPAMRRDFELNESVLRSLEILVEAIPEGERELHTAELAADFTIPPPPDDSHVDEPEEEEASFGARSRRSDDDDDEGGDAGEEDDDDEVKPSREH